MFTFMSDASQPQAGCRPWGGGMKTPTIEGE